MAQIILSDTCFRNPIEPLSETKFLKSLGYKAMLSEILLSIREISQTFEKLVFEKFTLNLQKNTGFKKDASRFQKPGFETSQNFLTHNS